MGVKVTNNGFGTLSAGINSSATTVTVDSGQGARFPALSSGDFFFATLVDTSNNLEIIKVTARSTDSMTVTRAQDNTSARAFSIGDRIELRPTAALFENAHLDNTPTSTGSFGLPKGTTAQQPTASATEGHIRYDTDDDVVYFSNGTSWIKISSVVATLSSVSGSIFAGVASTLTLSGTGFMSGANLVVNFTQTSDSINTNVTVAASSDTSATVTVPSAVYNNVTVGNAVSLKVTNADGVISGVLNTTAVALPSGGTITTSGSYRIHTFNSSGTFATGGYAGNVEYLVLGGGAGGGIQHGGGGGAGGYRTNVSGQSSGGGASAESAYAVTASQNITVTVGAGGAGVTTLSSMGGLRGASGGNSVFGTITSLGGGGGTSMATGNNTGNSGGSGGGGALDATGGGGTSAGGAGTSGQGYAGGTNNGYTNNNYGGGGGGGGAGGVGEDAPADGSAYNAGDGGVGVSSNITGSNVTRGGGGGGGSHNPFSPGGGGSSLGGNGGQGNSQAGFNAPNANTGSGGGGSGANNFIGGNGSSGVVIVRYTL